MDGSRFDALSRSLARGASRRTLLSGAASAALARFWWAREAPLAKKRGKHRKKHRRCRPECDGKTCGRNGCGGTCGTCSGGQTCNGTSCVCPSGQELCGGTCLPPCNSVRLGFVRRADCGCCNPAGNCATTADCCSGVCSPLNFCG